MTHLISENQSSLLTFVPSVHKPTLQRANDLMQNSTQQTVETGKVIMSIDQYDNLLEKSDLSSKLADGVNDFKQGNHEPFEKVMIGIRSILKI